MRSLGDASASSEGSWEPYSVPSRSYLLSFLQSLYTIMNNIYKRFGMKFGVTQVIHNFVDIGQTRQGASVYAKN